MNLKLSKENKNKMLHDMIKISIILIIKNLAEALLSSKELLDDISINNILYINIGILGYYLIMKNLN
jgi:hypothetical protein